MSCRKMLARLGERGLLRLPELRQVATRRAARVIEVVPVDETPMDGPLRSMRPILLERIDYHTSAARLFDSLLNQHHYLGHSYPIGANVRYLARAADGLPVACAVWASAALKVTARDRWIGWSQEARMRSLPRVTNNTRFCVLPWVRVPHLRIWHRIYSD